MNNIAQKNIIFENSKNNGFPYYNIGSIQYIGGQNINFATLNNTFQQLIDNDLYVENYIKNYADSVIGPKSSSPSAVQAGVEGYKAFSDDGSQLHIYRKHENPLSSSVSCVLKDVHANFIVQNGQYVIAGCDDGIYFEQDGFHRLLDDIPAYGQYFGDSVSLIASEDGVYSLVMKSGYGIGQFHKFIKLNSNDIGKCRSVRYIDETHTIVVGSDDGIYEGYCYSYQLNMDEISCSIDFRKMKMLNGAYQVEPCVNSIGLSGTVPLAATSLGLFKPDQAYDFFGYKHELTGHKIAYQIDNGQRYLVGADDGIYSMSYDYSEQTAKVIDLSDSIAAVSAKDHVYFATKEAIYKYSDGDLEVVVSGFNDIAVMQIYAVGNAEFLLFADKTTIYYMNNNADYSELFSISSTINDMLVEKNILTVAAASGIYKYRLYADSAVSDSDKIESIDQVYQSVLDGDFAPSGLINIGGNLFTYSSTGIKGLDTPGIFTKTSARYCCTYEREDGSTAVVAASGKDIFFLDSQLFIQSHIQAPADVIDIKTTSHAVLFRLTDKTLYQIHKKNAYTMNPTIEFIAGAVDIDDFTTYSEFAAMRSGTTLKFLQEQSIPSKLNKLSSEVVTGIQYNKNFDVIFISTRNGLSAVDMATYPYIEEQIYAGYTYGCWSDSDKVYCFTPHGVDVYDIRTVSDTENPSKLKPNYVSAYSVLDGCAVNEMCKFGDRFLYATTNGLYASVKAEKYRTVVDFDENDIQFYYQFLAPTGDSIFIFHDGNSFWRYDTENGIQQISSNLELAGKSDLSVTGQAISQYSNTLYIATDYGLYAYNVDSNALSTVLPSSSQVVGIQTVQYDNDSSKLIVGTYGAESDFNNRFFYEVDQCIFQEITFSSSIIDDMSDDRLIRVEAVPYSGIENAQLFLYLQTSSNTYEIRTVQIMRDGSIDVKRDFSVQTNIRYDNICASQDRFVYLTHTDGNSVSAWTYEFDGIGEKFSELSTNIQEVLKDSAGRIYIKIAQDGYYQNINRQLTRLLISDKTEWKLLGINWQQSYGYASIDGVGIVEINPDPTVTIPIRTNFPNSNLQSIQNVFGLILTSFDNKIYWSDVNSIEELSDKNKYCQLLNQREHFIKYYVSKDRNIVYAFGTKFICTWPAYDKESLITNSEHYIKETFGDIFTINHLIPHESYKTDLYLMNALDYDKPYIFGGTDSAGIYVYNSDNITMSIRTSNIDFASKLFQIPDGIAYISQDNVVQYTVNCDNSMPFDIFGMTLTNQTNDIKYDGKQYYVNIGGIWYYVYHKKLISIPAEIQIQNIMRTSNGTIVLSDTKFYKFNYYKMFFITASKIENAFAGYSIHKIFHNQNKTYYALRNNTGVYIYDSNYMPVRLQFEDRTGSNIFDDICFSDSGSLIMIQMEDSIYFTDSIDNAAQKYKIAGIVFPINLYVKDGYTALNTIDGIIRFRDYGIQNVYKQVDEISINFLKIQKIGENDYILCSPEGLYRYIQGFIYKMWRDADPATAIYMDMFDSEPGYIMAIRSTIQRSHDFIEWNTLFDISSTSNIKDIYAKSRNDYYVATDVGVFKTIYGYELINDIEQRNEYELQAVVDSLRDSLDSTFDYQLEDHIQKLHSADSQMNFINTKLLSVDMSGIAEDWQNIDVADAELVIDNDLVESIDFGDISALGCSITTENAIFAQSYAPADYILKRYMSGISELLVHVQTTNTYYLNGVLGSPVPNDEQQVISRKNLESIPDLDVSKKRQNSSVYQHATYIQLTIPNQVINMTEVHDIQISPCSLPLKIYAENVDANDMEKNGIFNSKIIPSVVLSYDTNNGMSVFKFACFGTDEQSIRIQFTEQYASTGTITVDFQPNGGIGVMPSQKFILGSAAQLNPVSFTNEEKFFAGWSFIPLQDGQSPTYTDTQYVTFNTEQYNDGDIIKLYAVWTKQDIKGDVNLFGIESNGTPLYIKTAVEVEPGQTIIDYGD